MSALSTFLARLADLVARRRPVAGDGLAARETPDGTVLSLALPSALWPHVSRCVVTDVDVAGDVGNRDDAVTYTVRYLDQPWGEGTVPHTRRMGTVAASSWMVVPAPVGGFGLAVRYPLEIIESGAPSGRVMHWIFDHRPDFDICEETV